MSSNEAKLFAGPTPPLRMTRFSGLWTPTSAAPKAHLTVSQLSLHTIWLLSQTQFLSIPQWPSFFPFGLCTCCSVTSNTSSLASSRLHQALRVPRRVPTRGHRSSLGWDLPSMTTHPRVWVGEFPLWSFSASTPLPHTAHVIVGCMCQACNYLAVRPGWQGAPREWALLFTLVTMLSRIPARCWHSLMLTMYSIKRTNKGQKSGSRAWKKPKTFSLP